MSGQTASRSVIEKFGENTRRVAALHGPQGFLCWPFRSARTGVYAGYARPVARSLRGKLFSSGMVSVPGRWGGLVSVEEVVLDCEQGGRAPGGDTDLGVDVLDVRIGGLERDDQPACDGLGRQAQPE